MGGGALGFTRTTPTQQKPNDIFTPAKRRRSTASEDDEDKEILQPSQKFREEVSSKDKEDLPDPPNLDVMGDQDLGMGEARGGQLPDINGEANMDQGGQQGDSTEGSYSGPIRGTSSKQMNGGSSTGEEAVPGGATADGGGPREENHPFSPDVT